MTRLQMAERKFTCAHCGGVFTIGWSEEEAEAEAREFFGYEVPEEQREELCDDCYGEFRKWAEALPAETRARYDAETRTEAANG